MSSLFNREGQTKTPTGKDERGRPTYHYRVTCIRCGGLGGAEQWRHTGWTCFRCAGTGTDPASPFVGRLYTADELERLNAAAAKRAATKAKKVAEKAAAEVAAKQASWEAWYQPRFTAVDLILAHRTDGDFLADIARRIEAGKYPADHVLDIALHSIIRKLAEGDQRAASQHVGKVGERVVLRLTVEKVIDISPSGGFPRIYRYVNLCRDAAGNRIVYVGNGWSEGETANVKVTIKEHGERNGERQTVVQRPMVLDDSQQGA